MSTKRNLSNSNEKCKGNVKCKAFSLPTYIFIAFMMLTFKNNYSYIATCISIAVSKYELFTLHRI